MKIIPVDELYNAQMHQNISLPEYLWKDRHFYTFYLPFLRRAEELVRQNPLWDRYISLEAERSFLTGLMNRLEAVCLRTLVVEIQYSRAGGMLGEGSPAEQYERFVEEYLQDREQMAAFWKTYTWLYEIVNNEVNRYTVFLGQILKHFQEDREELELCLGQGKKLCHITDIQMDRGDIHDDGKAVARLELDGGVSVYYKPGNKSLKAGFIKELNDLYEKQGLSVWDYHAVIKGDHTWEEAVLSEKCCTREDRFRYYRRLGIALLLCYQRGICDIHCENVISQGEFPVLIDVEVVKRRAKDRKMKWGFLNTSVLSAGILPCYMKGGGENRVNPAVLCLDRHQKSAVRHLVMKNPKTADICLELEYTELHFSNDIPVWTQEEEKEVTECIREGFRTAAESYKMQTGRKKEVCEVCRYIHRPTNEYAMLLFMLRHPKYLSRREEAEKMLHMALSRPGNGGVEDKKVAEWETEALLRGEIPLFTFREDSRRLYWRSDFVESFFADNPAQEIAAQKVQSGNLRIQEKLIEISMAGLRRDQTGFINSYGQKNLKEFLDNSSGEEACFTEGSGQMAGSEKIPESGQNICVLAVETLIGQIADMAFEDGQEADWWSVDIQFRSKIFWDVAEMPIYLYNGKAGTGLFFHSALASGISVSEKVRQITEKIDQIMFRHTEKYSSEAGKSSSGAMSGEYSIAYYYQYLYGLTGQTVYLDYASQHLEKLKGSESGDNYDLLSGLAGMALVWINQWRLTGERSDLEYAGHILDNLADFARREAAEGTAGVLPGMAHGWSGILLAFQRYALLTGQDRYDEVILLALEAENSWYRPELNNWEDLHRGEPMDTVAWCHGAAGILLCRMELTKSRNREIVAVAEQDAARAARKIQSMPLRKGYCLCHGNLGNMSILRKYAAICGDRKLEQSCEKYIRIIAGKFCSDTMKLLPQEKYDFGLMNGLSGIGTVFLDSGLAFLTLDV